MPYFKYTAAFCFFSWVWLSLLAECRLAESRHFRAPQVNSLCSDLPPKVLEQAQRGKLHALGCRQGRQQEDPPVCLLVKRRRISLLSPNRQPVWIHPDISLPIPSCQRRNLVLLTCVRLNTILPHHQLMKKEALDKLEGAVNQNR